MLALAPHPDDETLGCGGLLALASADGAPTRVAYLTDGEGSHPASLAWPPARLGARRRQEARRACHVLGVTRTPVFLGLPDAGTPGADLAAAAARLRAVILRERPGLVVTTWAGEPHCDHQAAWRVARAATAGTPARRLAFTVWAGRLSDERPSGAPLTLALVPARAAKRRALAAHRSQLGQVVRDDPGGFVLSARDREAMLGPAERYWA